MNSLKDSCNKVVLEKFQLPQDMIEDIFTPKLKTDVEYSLLEILVFMDSFTPNVVVLEDGNLFFKVVTDLEKEFGKNLVCEITEHKNKEFYFFENLGNLPIRYNTILLIS